MVRGLIDQALEAIAYLVLRGFFRSIEAAGLDRVPRRRPVLVVANHFYGFVDPVLLVYVLGRVPRFLAKATLWRRRWVRAFLMLAGILPVYRPEDGAPTADNASVFRASHVVLRKQGMVAMFPEGSTHDHPRLARLRTGAARIALSARAAGVQGLVVLPVGLVYDDKLALRSRALARFGDPIDLEGLIAEGQFAQTVSDSDHEAVRRLTAMIDSSLRAVSPDYRDAREAAVLSRAAEITLPKAGPGRENPLTLAERDGLAQRLAHAPPELRERLTDALARYALDLDLIGLRDHQVVHGSTARSC